MSQVAIAASSRISAEAGAAIAREGGNAVDAAVAAALVSAISEPGVCALGSGAYFSIWPVDGDPVTLDANVAVPGLGGSGRGRGAREIFMEYGGGVTTVVGHASVGTPGALAGCDMAVGRYGKTPWAEVMAPAIDWAERGFPMTMASYNYLRYAHELVFGWNPQSHAALHDESGEILAPGSPVRVAHLADSLKQIASEGIGAFYHGALATAIVEDMRAGNGTLTLEDLSRYEPVPRPCLRTTIREWEIATNPAPAVGGATLSAMLLLMKDHAHRNWGEDEVARLAAVQHQVLRFRREHLDESEALIPALETLVSLARTGRLDAMTAPSTVHVSAVDDSGLACAITMSAGYGSGVMPPGTGIWLNNCLGELELNCRGLSAGPPGARLPSNMAPCVARDQHGSSLAIGSPGADRITTALMQALVHFINRGENLEEAIRAPRLHVENAGGVWRVACEPGLATAKIALPQREFPELSMYFGGVGAALRTPSGNLVAAADPRRTGGTAVAGT